MNAEIPNHLNTLQRYIIQDMNWLKQNWMKVGLGILVLVVLFFIKEWDRSPSNTALISEIISPTVLPIPIETPEPLCYNENEVEDFKEPVPIVWTARIDGCLVSCWGLSFTRVPGNKKYPRFFASSLKYPD